MKHDEVTGIPLLKGYIKGPQLKDFLTTEGNKFQVQDTRPGSLNRAELESVPQHTTAPISSHHHHGMI